MHCWWYMRRGESSRIYTVSWIKSQRLKTIWYNHQRDGRSHYIWTIFLCSHTTRNCQCKCPSDIHYFVYIVLWLLRFLRVYGALGTKTPALSMAWPDDTRCDATIRTCRARFPPYTTIIGWPKMMGQHRTHTVGAETQRSIYFTDCCCGAGALHLHIWLWLLLMCLQSTKGCSDAVVCDGSPLEDDASTQIRNIFLWITCERRATVSVEATHILCVCAAHRN